MEPTAETMNSIPVPIVDARVHWSPKDEQYESEYEDAHAVNFAMGRAAIADGVSSAIFSRQWARLLVDAAVASPPNLNNSEAFTQWLTMLRGAWRQEISQRQLNWAQRQKLQQAGGAYSTLLWIEADSPSSAELATVRVRCHAIGDCCLFHIRDGQLRRSFPMASSEQFDLDPASICSVDRRNDHRLEFQYDEVTCQDGDTIVLATDAFAKWALERLEAHGGVDWNAFEGLGGEEWSQLIRQLRDKERMRFDDTTLVTLRIARANTQVQDGNGSGAGTAVSDLIPAAGLEDRVVTSHGVEQCEVLDFGLEPEPRGDASDLRET